MKIKLTPEKCIACGSCQLSIPDIFDCYDNGIVKFVNTNVKEKSFTSCVDILPVIQKCPANALSIKKR